MGRAGVFAALCSMGFAQSGPVPEILQAARSPYELARYVDTHVGFEWKPLWERFKLQAPLLPCSQAGECSTELITVLDPPQTILVIDTPWDTEAYFRYLGSERDGWKVAGAFSGFTTNYPRRHEITRIGRRPFLRISQQGSSGSDVSSEIEQWFDLADQEFVPAFSFTPQGHEHRMGFGVSRKLHAVVSAGAAETMRVLVTVRYMSYEDSNELGRTEFAATYARRAGQKRFTLREVTREPSGIPVPTERFEKLVDLDEGGASNELLISEALPGLKKVASGDNADARGWLRSMLSNVKDTPEKRELVKLLDEP